MFELRKRNTWGYTDTVLRESECIQDIITSLLEACRKYYNEVSMDCPWLEISTSDKLLILDCGRDFCDLNTDEKVIASVMAWCNDKDC